MTIACTDPFLLFFQPHQTWSHKGSNKNSELGDFNEAPRTQSHHHDRSMLLFDERQPDFSMISGYINDDGLPERSFSTYESIQYTASNNELRTNPTDSLQSTFSRSTEDDTFTLDHDQSKTVNTEYDDYQQNNLFCSLCTRKGKFQDDESFYADEIDDSSIGQQDIVPLPIKSPTERQTCEYDAKWTDPKDHVEQGTEVLYKQCDSINDLSHPLYDIVASNSQPLSTHFKVVNPTLTTVQSFTVSRLEDDPTIILLRGCDNCHETEFTVDQSLSTDLDSHKQDEPTTLDKFTLDDRQRGSDNDKQMLHETPTMYPLTHKSTSSTLIRWDQFTLTLQDTFKLESDDLFNDASVQETQLESGDLVSTAPVQETLRQLDSEDLVYNVPVQKTVCQLDSEDRVNVVPIQETLREESEDRVTVVPIHETFVYPCISTDRFSSLELSSTVADLNINKSSYGTIVPLCSSETKEKSTRGSIQYEDMIGSDTEIIVSTISMISHDENNDSSHARNQEELSQNTCQTNLLGIDPCENASPTLSPIMKETTSQSISSPIGTIDDNDMMSSYDCDEKINEGDGNKSTSNHITAGKQIEKTASPLNRAKKAEMKHIQKICSSPARSSSSSMSTTSKPKPSHLTKKCNSSSSSLSSASKPKPSNLTKKDNACSSSITTALKPKPSMPLRYGSPSSPSVSTASKPKSSIPLRNDNSSSSSVSTASKSKPSQVTRIESSTSASASVICSNSITTTKKSKTMFPLAVDGSRLTPRLNRSISKTVTKLVASGQSKNLLVADSNERILPKKTTKNLLVNHQRKELNESPSRIGIPSSQQEQVSCLVNDDCSFSETSHDIRCITADREKEFNVNHSRHENLSSSLIGSSESNSLGISSNVDNEETILPTVSQTIPMIINRSISAEESNLDVKTSTIGLNDDMIVIKDELAISTGERHCGTEMEGFRSIPIKRSVCDDIDSESDTASNSLLMKSRSSSSNSVYTSDSLSAARRRQSTLLQKFQELMSLAKANCLASYNDPQGKRSDTKLTGTNIRSTFAHIPLPTQDTSKTIVSNPSGDSCSQLVVEKMITIESHNDSSITFVVLEDSTYVSNNTTTSITCDNPTLSMDQLHTISLEDGRLIFIDNYDDVSIVVNSIEKWVEEEQCMLRYTNAAMDIQRVFRGYRARRIMMLQIGLAKRKKWEPKSKSISTTIIHSRFRRLARANLRDRALSSDNYSVGGGSMIVAIRRACATIIQRYWRGIVWKRKFEEGLIMKFMMRHQRMSYVRDKTNLEISKFETRYDDIVLREIDEDESTSSLSQGSYSI